MTTKSQHLKITSFAIFMLFFSIVSLAQTPSARRRITEVVDDQVRITRTGNLHPLARPEYDRGVAPDSLPAGRMLLLLQRGAEQDAALKDFLEQQQVPSSPNYHKWLTPTEFGQLFGPSEADVATVTNWLRSQGFQVNTVAAGRNLVEFSGTAAQVRNAFRTEIHKFVVNGQEHWANVANPQIPAALAPVVSGVVSLHNFRRKPMSHVYAAQDTKRDPDFTIGTSYGLGPADFATIYNTLPLWTSGINGTGQTVAIVGRTNINIQDVRDFRTMFGLTANDPEIILNGIDPGITDDEVEADLDVQWSGAVAPNAKIKFVTSASTDVADGIDLSAFYIIDRNLAPVMSLSYGACERDLGTNGNAFYNTLWQQAQAQGISIFVSSGDSGSAACDAPDSTAAANGNGINGIGSTPFNISVGGTDFDQVNLFSTYWNSTNDPTTRLSAKSYIPEMTWNESCAQQGSSCSGSDGKTLWAGSGGPSTKYAKPSWQSGPGVPADAMRDTPDVSLFASGGFNNSAYWVCHTTTSGSCATGRINRVGGTSASAPAFAGIMALVNQYQAAHGGSGRQGNANYTFYKLAAQPGQSCNSTTAGISSSCSFYDTTKGNISVPCTAGTPNCVSGILVDPNHTSTPAWTTTTGYDLATGLGSVNVANLATNWSAVAFAPTTTTITTPGPISGTHGQAVTLTGSVTSTSGTPSGNVSLIANVTGGSRGLDAYPLTGGTVTAQTTSLPGGTYNAILHYEGNGTFAPSDSAPVQVTISAETSKTIAGMVTYDLNTGNILSHQASTAAYGSPYILEVNVGKSTATLTSLCYTGNISTCPTGTITLNDNGALLDGGTFVLNSLGFTDDQHIQLPPGTHNITASYSGDSSFLASSGSTSVIITKATTAINTPSADSASVAAGVTVNITVKVTTLSNGAAPTGTVTFYDGGTPISGNISYTGTDGQTGPASLTATIAAAFSTSGTKTITAKYNGDANYSLSPTSGAVTVTVTGGGSVPDFTMSTASSTLPVASAGQSGSTTVTINSISGYAGAINLTCTVNSSATHKPDCSLNPTSVTTTANGSMQATLTVTTTGPHTNSASLKGASWLGGGIFACVLLGMPGRKRKLSAMLVLLVIAMVAIGGMTACGGGGGTTPPTSKTDPGTPGGSYGVSITGSAPSINTSHTITVSVTVP